MILPVNPDPAMTFFAVSVLLLIQLIILPGVNVYKTNLDESY